MRWTEETMSRTIFFSWQTDRPSLGGRNLIEKALETAAARIAAETDVEEAIRDEGLKVDKDTKGVPGSPPIFATILDKIDKATAFVPDLIFVGLRPDGRPTPNPNVMIEYGWVLKSLTSSRIVAVMNAAYGASSWESLPFELAAFRFPITYNVPKDAEGDVRAEERKKLANALRQL
jgi:hypothetical protein